MSRVNPCPGAHSPSSSQMEEAHVADLPPDVPLGSLSSNGAGRCSLLLAA